MPVGQAYLWCPGEENWRLQVSMVYTSRPKAFDRFEAFINRDGRGIILQLIN